MRGDCKYICRDANSLTLKTACKIISLCTRARAMSGTKVKGSSKVQYRVIGAIEGTVAKRATVSSDLPIQSRTSSRRRAMACTDIRATISESSTKEVTYSLHSKNKNE